jgi:hypothetical protein
MPTQESSRPHERTCRVTSPYVTSPEKLHPMRQGAFADTRRKKSLQLDQTHQEEQLSVSDIVSPKTPSLADRRIPYRILQTELRRFSSRSNTSLLSTEYEQAAASPPPGCHIVGEPVARRSSRPCSFSLFHGVTSSTETRQTQQASSWHAPRTDSATSRERFPDPLCSATKLQRGHRITSRERSQERLRSTTETTKLFKSSGSRYFADLVRRRQMQLADASTAKTKPKAANVGCQPPKLHLLQASPDSDSAILMALSSLVVAATIVFAHLL